MKQMDKQKPHTPLIERISPFTLILTLVILMMIGASLIPLIDVTSSPRPRQGKKLDITYDWRNASPKVIEQEVTSKIEGIVSAVKGVEGVSSESHFGWGIVRVGLKKEVDVSATKFEIASLLRQIAKKLPEGCSYPQLKGGEVINERTDKSTTLRLLSYRINAQLEGEQIQEYIRNHVEPTLMQVDGVKRVDVSGGTTQYLEITYDPLLLANYDIAVNDVAEGIRNFMGKEHIIGDLLYDDELGDRSRITMHLATNPFTREIGEIPLKRVGDKIVYLNNLATYTYRDRLPWSYYRVNGLNTIYMNIEVDAEENLIALSDDLQQRIEALKPQLSEGIHLTLLHDEAKQKKSELEKLLTRTLAALVILLLFVWLVRRSWKYLSIITITLLANMLIAVIAYYLFDVRLHTFALAGITVSLGLIIDASIVMVDHYSYYQNRKAFLAILAALLTTIGALIIVFFMPDYIKNDLYDFSGIIIINLTVALVVAYLFVPALVTRMGYSSKREFIPPRRAKRIVRWTHLYHRYICFTQRHKWVYYTLLILAFGIPFHALPDKWKRENVYYMSNHNPETAWYETAYNNTIGSRFYQSKLKEPICKIFGGSMRLFATSTAGNTFAKEKPKKRLYIRGQMPLGGTVHELNEKVQILENFLTEFDEIARFETRIDGGGANITVDFKDEVVNGSFPYLLESKTIGTVLNIGGADWSTSGVSERGFSNSLNLQYRSNRIEIAGYNYNKLYRYAEDICEKLKTNNRVTDIIIETPGHERQADELYMIYNHETLALQEADLNAIHGTLAGLLSSVELGRYTDRYVNTTIDLKSVQRDEFDLWTLRNSHLQVGDQNLYLPHLMEIDKRAAKNCIPKKNQEYILRVAFNVLGSYMYTSDYIKSVTEELNESFPVGYRCVNQSYGWYQDDGTQYWLILVVAIIIFFMCAILFESLRLPWVILSLILVSFIGTFLTFYFSGINFGTGGFASLVLLCGIVVNSGLYIINEYKQMEAHLAAGVSLSRRYVKAYNHKVIPVFLTTLSTVLGLLPFLVDGGESTFWYSFAVGTIGGLLFSIPALVFIMPIFMPLRGKR